MNITLFLLVALASLAAFILGLRRGERMGRRQSRSDLDAIAGAAAERSNRQAEEAYRRLAGEAVQTLRSAARTDRETDQAAFSATTQPLRDSLERFAALARRAQEQRDRDSGAVEALVKNLHRKAEAVEQGARSLREALRGDRPARGRWGEIQLQNLVESAGLVEHCDFAVQRGQPGGGRPDLTIHLPGGGRLAVDAKVPMDAYLRASEEKNPERRRALFRNHAAQVRKHGIELSRRNYPAELGAGPPFTVLFLPLECLLAEAIRSDEDLLRHAAENRIVLATPYTLMGLLWSVAAMWKHETSSRNAEEMRRAGLVLEERLRIFVNHLGTVGKRIGQTVKAYDAAIGSAEARLAPQFRKLRRLGGVEENGAGVLPEPLSLTPRKPRRDVLGSSGRSAVA